MPAASPSSVSPMSHQYTRAPSRFGSGTLCVDLKSVLSVFRRQATPVTSILRGRRSTACHLPSCTNADGGSSIGKNLSCCPLLPCGNLLEFGKASSPSFDLSSLSPRLGAAASSSSWIRGFWRRQTNRFVVIFHTKAKVVAAAAVIVKTVSFLSGGPPGSEAARGWVSSRN